MTTATTLDPRTLPPPPRLPRRPDVEPPPRAPEVDSNISALGHLVAVMGQDPRTRPKVLELLREADPTLAIPELDVAHAANVRIDSATTELRKENATLTQRLATVENRINRERWQDENGVDDEEFGEVLKFAQEKKIGDPNAALDYFRKAELGRPRGTLREDDMTEDSRKLLYKNPKQWYEQKAQSILAESRRRRGA